MARSVRLAIGALAAATLATGALSALPSPPPRPEAVLGFTPCAERRLATYEQIAAYFTRLDEASDRVRLFDIGRTAEGRVQILAAISSPANLKQLDRYKDIARRLAFARGVTDAEARSLAREGRAIVWIDFGLHSSELAHAQAAPLVAWRVAADDTEEMTAIRDNVILVLVPNMNPDGTTLWAEWYARHVGTPYERSAPPVLYHRYAGHDNNRDWFMFNMPESRNVGRQLYFEWLPQIVYNHHQEAPFPARIFIPPFDDPMNPNIPPLVMHGVTVVGDAMGRRLAQEGKTGVLSRGGFDSWWNGGMRTAPYFHNMVGIMTETAHSSPSTVVYDPARFPAAFDNGTPTLEPSMSYPSPYRGGRWSFRDSCDYMVSASLATLDIGARRRKEWLYDVYQMARDAIASGQHETYIVPEDQWDRGAAGKLVNVLRLGGVVVERATAPFEADGTRYAAGSFLVRGAQAFRPYVIDLLGIQRYPDWRRLPDGPPLKPYDVTAWTLPLQMGVRVDRVGHRVDAATTPVHAADAPGVAPPARARFGYAVDPRTNDAFAVVNRLLAAGERVERTTSPVRVAGDAWPAGTFIVTAGAGTGELVTRETQRLGVPAVALDVAPEGAVTPLGKPRVALYQAWGGNMDEGWTRWLLEQFEFPYSTVHDEDIRAGALGRRFDVIVLPDASYDSMLKGLATGSAPPEYTGGMTPPGVAHLYEFVRDGGTLVALDTASQLPLIAFGVPVTDVTAGRRDEELYVPGSLLRVTVDSTHPVAYGMPDQAAAFFARSHAFDTAAPQSRTDTREGRPVRPAPGIRVVARYADHDLLMSGSMTGTRLLAGRAAVVEARIERGRVVLIGFRAQHRGQPHATFKLLFNALYLGASPPPAAHEPVSDTR